MPQRVTTPQLTFTPFPGTSGFQNGFQNDFLVIRIFRVTSKPVLRAFGFPEVPSERFFGRSDFQSGGRKAFAAALIFRAAAAVIFHGRECSERVPERCPSRSESQTSCNIASWQPCWLTSITSRN